jgi:hypothetical protein
MAFDDCKMNPIPGCPNYDRVYGNQASQGTPVRCNRYGNIVDCPDPVYPAQGSANVTGEVCVNAEYDAWIADGFKWQRTAVGGGYDVMDIPVPAHYESKEGNFCVDVYNNDLADASNRLNSLLEEKKAKENWRNDKYYCMYGITRFFMSLFQPDSLAYSDKYCGKS